MSMRRTIPWLATLALLTATGLTVAGRAGAEGVDKPVLHARHWLAITGKPLAATAGAMTFQKGGNAVDAACTMLAAACTMWDTLGWGGETQALIYNPKTGKVIALDGLGVAPTGATADFFKKRGERYPPEWGPLAAVTPGTPGALMTLLAEYGTMSLGEVLEPAIRMAEGYPIEAQLIRSIRARRELIEGWPHSKAVFLPGGEPPEPGQVFKQPDLAATLHKLVEAEHQALAAGKSRKEAIYAAYDRFYKGDIADELVRGTREAGGLITKQDLADWQVKWEEPALTTYKGIDVYKLTTWTQGPVMLQALNLLEPLDLQAMGYNSARYIHTLYQVMNLAYADRDFYYGDPYFPPAEPVAGLLSKAYADQRRGQIDWTKNDPEVKPGNPYDFQEGDNPFLDLLKGWPPPRKSAPAGDQQAEMGASVQRYGHAPRAPGRRPGQARDRGIPGGLSQGAQRSRGGCSGARMGAYSCNEALSFDEAFRAGTTSVLAADESGWVVSMTPSGAWVPAFIAGHTGVGLSQRMQSFVTDRAENPYNVVEPGKRPRVTLTPSLALKDGKPYLASAVQGGDTQDQNLLQFFLNVVEFGMNVQESAEAANITSYQMLSSFGQHESRPGWIDVREDTPPWVQAALRKMGYHVTTKAKTSGPINAIYFDQAHGTLWGGSSDYGEDYGEGW